MGWVEGHVGVTAAGLDEHYLLDHCVAHLGAWSCVNINSTRS